MKGYTFILQIITLYTLNTLQFCQLYLSKAEKGKYNTTSSCRTSPQLYQLLPSASSILLLSLSTHIYTHTHTHVHKCAQVFYYCLYSFFWSIWKYIAVIIPLYFLKRQPLLLRNKKILLEKYSTMIKLSTFNVETMLLSSIYTFCQLIK